MGMPVIVYGNFGSGKSRSLKFFGEEEILLVNVEGKTLPFKKKFKYQMKTDDIDTMIAQMKKMPCKIAVVDDTTYIMTHKFMNNHRNKKGNASFDMYDDIADSMYFLVQKVKTELPDDVIVYIIMHEDMNDMGSVKLRTIGKLIDNKVSLEGMVTICLRCRCNDMGEHFFLTQSDGYDITKTPEDLFADEKIDNNLKLVDQTIREFYGFDNTDKKESEDK